MKFSLIIATLNRPKQLRVCINKILEQSYKDYEIIVVDQSDDENYDSSIAKMSNKINYIRIKEKGLSHARNIGIRICKGDYICLVDDDGLYTKDVLKIANSIILKYNPIVLAGKIIDPKSGVAKAEGRDCVVSWKDAFTYHVSPSMIIKKDFLISNQFDEMFGVGASTGYGCGEESDIVLAALSQNKLVYYTDEYIVNHIVTKQKIPSKKRIELYAYGQGALYRKTVELYSKKWGYFYFLKSFLGNFLMGYILDPFNIKKITKIRRIKSKRVLAGYMSYRNYLKGTKYENK